MIREINTNKTQCRSRYFGKGRRYWGVPKREFKVIICSFMPNLALSQQYIPPEVGVRPPVLPPRSVTDN